MQELLTIMDAMARLLASGVELTLENAIKHVPLHYDKTSGAVRKTGNFDILGVLENGAAFELSGAVSHGRMLMIWFRDGYAVEGSVAQLTPPHGKRIHPSPKDDGYLVAFKVSGVDASFMVSRSPERITLMTCEDRTPERPSLDLEEPTQFERLANLLSALRRQNVACRLDRHAPDGLTVTFVWADRLIECCFEDDEGKMWFSHFAKEPEPLAADAVMKIIDEHWREESCGPNEKAEWQGVADPFARMLAFTRMLDAERITWRVDSFEGRSVRLFMTLIGVRLEAYVEQDGMTFAAFMGSEDVFYVDQLQALVPGLSLE